MSTPSEPLDRERIGRLTEQIMLALNRNYQAGPLNRDRVYEALNSLAFCAAWVIRTTGKDPEALEFFSKALNINLTDEH
jgi:hypothetical protein